MTPDVVTIAPDESLQDAAELMISKHVRALPVVNAEGQMIGLLTRRHIVQAMLQWSERQETQD
ncbi:inosine 5'-monophosphate dehydrogenase [compost metagenome]